MSVLLRENSTLARLPWNERFSQPGFIVQTPYGVVNVPYGGAAAKRLDAGDLAMLAAVLSITEL
jgi:hypothetical protein